MPAPEKLDKVPPDTETSAPVKSVEDSLSVNVTTVLSPRLSVVLLAATAIVGRTVSTAIVTVLFALAPSLLKLPASSENVLLATLTTPLAVLLAVGVKVAV